MVENIFCIGNGESRKGYDLDKLKPHGKIYGCNAVSYTHLRAHETV